MKLWLGSLGLFAQQTSFPDWFCYSCPPSAMQPRSYPGIMPYSHNPRISCVRTEFRPWCLRIKSSTWKRDLLVRHLLDLINIIQHNAWNSIVAIGRSTREQKKSTSSGFEPSVQKVDTKFPIFFVASFLYSIYIFSNPSSFSTYFVKDHIY